MNKTLATLTTTGLLVAALSGCSLPTAGVAAPAADLQGRLPAHSRVAEKPETRPNNIKFDGS